MKKPLAFVVALLTSIHAFAAALPESQMQHSASITRHGKEEGSGEVSPQSNRSNRWVFDSQPERPRTAGTIQLEGLRERIEIRRDRDGVSHIQARSEQDGLFALGYVHAQDRLWQMEFQRRLGNGRLAEILGAPGLPTDRLFRTIGLHRAAAAAWDNLNPEERQPIEAYVAGINAYLDNKHNQQLPPEFNLLNVEAEPWRPEDVLVWGKVVAWSLSSNWDKELLRAQLTAKLGPAKTAQLMPAYTADGPTILPDKRLAVNDRRRASGMSVQSSALVPDSSILSGLLDLNRAIEERTGLGADGFGSNNWVLGGARTTRGRPLLASDPHLTSQTPAIWGTDHGVRFNRHRIIVVCPRYVEATGQKSPYLIIERNVT